MQLLRAAMRALYPTCRCLACGEPRRITPGEPLCDACLAELALHAIPDTACPHCLSPKRSGNPCGYCQDGGMIGLAHAYAPFYYGGVVQRLVVMFKFGAVDAAARPLASAMAACLGTARPDALVPVPLHRQRQRERGINQARRLCHLVSEQTGLPIQEALVRTRKTKRQSSLEPRDRESNVRGAFAVTQPVAGMRLMLVDDVRTSGSTARACAQALREAGTAEVSLLTASVAPQHARGWETQKD